VITTSATNSPWSQRADSRRWTIVILRRAAMPSCIRRP